jgi:hypothetical protein
VQTTELDLPIEVPKSRRYLISLARWLSFPNAILSLLFFLLFSNNTKKIIESDIWWHLRNAQYILKTRSFPSIDQYSFTAAGSPWLDHEWLSEIFYYGAFNAYGLRGIFILYLGLSIIIFAGLYYLSYRAGANPKDIVIVATIGILLAGVSFGPRMLLFGWVCTIALLIILQNYISSDSRIIWLTPPLFCVWINLHGSWIFGLVVLGIYVISGLFQADWGLVWAERFSRSELKRLMYVSTLTFGALFVNPFGYKLVAYPFDLAFRQQINIANIEEWQSVNFHDPRGKVVMMLLLAVFTVALLSGRRWRLNQALLATFALYWGLTYARMQFFIAIIFMPLLSVRLQMFPPYDAEKEKPLLNGLIIFGVLGFFLSGFPSESDLESRVRAQFPHAALDYMKDHQISERVLADYRWGGYMIWHAPQIKTFIDGRADLFVYNGVFDDYLKFNGIIQPLEVLDKHNIQFALLIKNTPQSYLLAHHPCWPKIYSDEIAVLYKRTTESKCALPVSANPT